MALLDAVPCIWGDCYSNVGAINVKIAINTADWKLLSYSGGYWQQKDNPTQLLAKKMNGYHNSTIVIENAVGVANNNVYYDGCEGGVLNFDAANNYCTSKGMRWAKISETTVSSTTYVPSCGGSYTWAQWTYSAGYYYWIWSGGTSSYNYEEAVYGKTYQTRCVISF